MTETASNINMLVIIQPLEAWWILDSSLSEFFHDSECEHLCLLLSAPEIQQQPDIQLAERLMSLGIIRVRLRAALKPLVHHSTIVLRGLQRAFNCSPIMPRDTSLSNRYMSDRHCFSSVGWCESNHLVIAGDSLMSGGTFSFVFGTQLGDSGDQKYTELKKILK